MKLNRSGNVFFTRFPVPTEIPSILRDYTFTETEKAWRLETEPGKVELFLILSTYSLEASV